MSPLQSMNEDEEIKEIAAIVANPIEAGLEGLERLIERNISIDNIGRIAAGLSVEPWKLLKESWDVWRLVTSPPNVSPSFGAII